MTGKIWGMGIGPGDPELITLKAYNRLREADVVAYPAPEVGDSLVRSIVADHLPIGIKEYAIRMPLVEARFPAQQIYDKAALDIEEMVQQGKNVAVLCEGDPFFYGSFMYLFGRLSESCPMEVIPGVSSLTASAAMLRSPLAARNDVLTVLPGPLDEDALRSGIEKSDAVAIIKVGRHFEKIHRVLSDLDLLDCARYVERATMENQRILPINDLEDNKAPYFSIILVHKRGEAWTV